MKRVASLPLRLALMLAGVAVSLQAATLTIDWDPVTTNSDGSAITDLAGYTVFQSTKNFNQGGVFISTSQALADTSILKINVTAPTLSYTSTSLAPALRYYFRVTAFDSAGNHSLLNLDSGGNPTQISYLTPSSPSACDVNAIGGVDVSDVQLSVLQALFITPCTPYTQSGSADMNQDMLCNVIDVQRIVFAALGGACVSP